MRCPFSLQAEILTYYIPLSLHHQTFTMSLARLSPDYSFGRVYKKQGWRPKSLFDLSDQTVSVRTITSLIEAISAEMVYYSRCLDKGLSYKVDKSLSGKYSECLHSGQPYDIVDLSLKGVYRLISDKAKTKTDLDIARSKANRLLQALINTQAEASRLERQYQLLKTYGTKLIRRSLRSIEEME